VDHHNNGVWWSSTDSMFTNEILFLLFEQGVAGLGENNKMTDMPRKRVACSALLPRQG
jgi:hypothetical protein